MILVTLCWASLNDCHAQAQSINVRDLYLSNNLERFTMNIDPSDGGVKLLFRGRIVMSDTTALDAIQIENLAYSLYLEFEDKGYLIKGYGLGWSPKDALLGVHNRAAQLSILPCTISTKGLPDFQINEQGARISTEIASVVQRLMRNPQDQWKIGLLDAVMYNSHSGHIFLLFSEFETGHKFVHSVDLNSDPPEVSISPLATQHVSRP